MCVWKKQLSREAHSWDRRTVYLDWFGYWQALASGLPQEKFRYGWLHRRLLRRYRPQSAMSCSTLQEQAAGSSPNTSQVSLLRLRRFHRQYDLLPRTPIIAMTQRRRTLLKYLSFWNCSNSRMASWRSRQLDFSWAVARIKIARVILAIRLDWNWSSFQLASSAPPLSVTDSAIAPSARIVV